MYKYLNLSFINKYSKKKKKKLLLNGVDLSNSSYIQKIRFLASQNFYNPLKFIFAPNVSMEDSQKSKITLQLEIIDTDAILNGSISHNLP
jgi:hypothetical protein